MRINFIIPFIQKTGGIAVILEHALGLRRLGHDVAVYYPLLPYRQFLAAEKSPFRKYVLGQLKPFLGNAIRHRAAVPWFSRPAPVVPVSWISGAFVRDADVTLATAWPTAYDVAALPPRKGRKFYFVQHYENWDSDPALVDGSYRLPLEILTIAPWLTALMRDKFARPVAAEIHNGVDLSRFHPPAARDWSRPALLMMYHTVEWKGAADGLKALEAVHGRHPEIPIRMFGMHPFPEAPAYVEYHLDPAPEALLALYQASTIFLSPSHAEGWHLPPMEAMACGCALVATTVGCIPVLNDGGNMRVAPPRDVDALAGHLESLIKSPALARDLAGRGEATMAAYSWEKSTARLLAGLEGSRPGAA